MSDYFIGVYLVTCQMQVTELNANLLKSATGERLSDTDIL